MNDYKSRFLYWKEKIKDPELRQELWGLDNNAAELQDRFSKYLEFGTGGMRGIIGAGSNRMNIYTVRKTAQGLANYLNNAAPANGNKVVLAYDSRHKSREFALEAALVLAHNQIKSYLFHEITPTPLLSFAVRELKAQAGIVITASHNPKEYNGLKLYNSQGGQITDELAAVITREITRVSDEFAVEIAEQATAEQQGLLNWLHDDILDTYLENALRLVLNKELLRQAAASLKIVYSPLHGTGLVSLTKLFAKAGFTNLHIVEEQAEADPDFPTVVCPNPEDDEACLLPLEQATDEDADLVMLTDPDADRIGVVVKTGDGDYLRLTGNQIGALLIDYILQTRQQNGTIPENGIIVKTIVTSDLGAAIASKYGVPTLEVLTGFKYIGEKINEFESDNAHTFLFGYEESYGYLIGDFVRDKDAIQTSLCLAEMALYHKTRGSSLYLRLQELFREFGCYREHLFNLTFEGIQGRAKMAELISAFRANPPKPLHEYGLIAVKDYLTGHARNLQSGQTNTFNRTPVQETALEQPSGKIAVSKRHPNPKSTLGQSFGKRTAPNLPPSDVLYYTLKDGAWCCIRPSGTEPKLKIYLGVRSTTAFGAQQELAQLKATIEEVIKPFYA